MIQPVDLHGLEDDLRGLAVAVLGLGGVDVEELHLDRRGAAADPEVEPPPAQLVEHADLLERPQRVVQVQQHDQGPQPQPAGALGHRRQEHVRRGGQAMRRAVMLGHVIGPEARPVAGLGEVQAMPVLLADIVARIIEMIEHAELDRPQLKVALPEHLLASHVGSSSGSEATVPVPVAGHHSTAVLVTPCVRLRPGYLGMGPSEATG